MMKRITFLLLSVSMLLFLIGCGNDTTEEKNHLTQIIENNYYLTVKNTNIELTILKENGNINSFKNPKTNKDFLEDAEGDNFTFKIDMSTNNPYKTKQSGGSVLIIESSSFQPEITYKRQTDGIRIDLNYHIEKEINGFDINGIDVSETITINDNSCEVAFDYMIENFSSEECIITSFEGIILSGFNDEGDNFSLFSPDREGMIHNNAISNKKQVSLPYPSDASMQLMQLYNDKESLYYFTKDATREYKRLNFTTNNNEMAMSVEQYPYVADGKWKKLHTTIVGVSNEGSYFAGSDSYREFLINSDMTRKMNDYARTWTGTMAVTMAQYEATPNIKYVDPTKLTTTADQMIASVNSNHIDNILLIGWHAGGFDSRYPDYDYIEGSDFGEANFVEMINKIHDQNDYVVPYLNVHVAAENSNWKNKKYSSVPNMDYAAIKKEGYDAYNSKYYYREYYGTSTSYLAMCPKASNFQSVMYDAVNKLVNNGVDGLWLDQLMEMPAYLCYDESHGHENPATAYAEGFSEMLEEFDNIFKRKNKEDYVIFCEGVTDAWIKWVDVCGYMWGRKLFHVDSKGNQFRPDYVNYTIPSKFLGIFGNSGLTHGYAYLFGSPLIDGTSIIDTKITESYINNPDIYFNGRYLASRYLEIDNDNVRASIIMGSDQKSFGLQIHNLSNKNETVKIKIDLNKLGINPTKLVAMFDDTEYKIIDNTLSLTLLPNDLIGIRIEEK